MKKPVGEELGDEENRRTTRSMMRGNIIKKKKFDEFEKIFDEKKKKDARTKKPTGAEQTTKRRPNKKRIPKPKAKNITPDKPLNNTHIHVLDDNGQHIGNTIQLDNIYVDTGNNGQVIGNINLDPMADPSPWKVVNYQIPVPIGDCSAHFLVDKLTGTVQRAFLMDGGTNAGVYAAWAQIMKGLRFIDLQLGNGWKFDSWVVTHWDEDHFRGVKDLLVNKEIEFTRCKGNGAKVTKGDPGSFVSLYFDPKPVLLCGAWDAPVMFKGGGDFLRPFVKENKILSWSRFKTAKTRSKKGKDLLRCIWGENLIGLDLFTRSFYFNRETGEVDYKASEETYYTTEDENDSTSKNKPRFCVVGANGYGIGQPDACESKPSRNETSILALLYWPGKKCFSYYTGGDGHPNVFKGPVKEWFMKHWPGGDVEMVKLDHHGSTKENLGKILHAEDEDENIEEEKTPSKAVSNDIAEEKASIEAVSNDIAEEKASIEAVSNDIAEGKASIEEVPSESDTESESELVEENLDTPDDLEIEMTNDPEDAREIGIVIDYMKPSKVLVTPGTRHGHPTWDVLVTLRRYFEQLPQAISGQDSDNKQVRGLFSTRSVYWFGKDKVSYKDINFNHVRGTVLQKWLKIAEKDDTKMLEEKVRQDPNDANKGGQDIEEEDDDNDPAVEYALLQIADAPERAKAQENWATSKEAYVNHILSKANSAKYYKKNGDRNWDAINLAVVRAIEDFDRKRRKGVKRESTHFQPALIPGSLRNILEDLIGAFDELIEATDDAQLEGVENFEEICWQPLVVSEKEDPHFLIRFEFGEQRQDTVLKVFDASGQYEYEEDNTQSEKKANKQSNSKRPRRSNRKRGIHEESKEQESIHEENAQEEIIQRYSKTATGLLTEDENNPWTKQAYGDGDIATMLSDNSFWTITSPRMAARIKKLTKKQVPTVAKSERNMIYKYYDKIKDNAAIHEMMVREAMNGSKSVNEPPDDEEQDLDVGKPVGLRNKRIAKREVKDQPKKEGKGKKETKEGKGKKRN